MGTKIGLGFTICILSFSAMALEEIEVRGSDKSTKVYALENEIMVHSNNGEAPARVRTNLRSTQNIKPGDKVSEIFSEGPRGNGRLRSLPGGVVVKFSEGVDPENWALDNDLTIEKELKPGLYLISSPAGRASISKANEIAEMDGVESVEPNWWTNVKSKSSVPLNRLPASLDKALKNSFKR